MASSLHLVNENLNKIVQDRDQKQAAFDARIDEDIAILQQWIQQQLHLRVKMNPQYLLTFLCGCKYSLEKTKSKIEYFYMIKTLVPEIFKNRRMDQKYCEFARSGTYFWPRKINSSDPGLGFVRFRNFNASKFTLIDIIRYSFMALEGALIKGHIQIVGIYDLDQVPYEIYTQLDIAMLKKIRVFIEKGVPAKFTGIHILNCPKKYLYILNYLKMFLNEKLKTRVYTHESIESLYEFIPRERLPAEYGGSNGTVSEIAAQNTEEMINFDDFLIEDDKNVVDKQLKPKNTQMDEESLFGLEGSFRKLQID